MSCRSHSATEKETKARNVKHIISPFIIKILAKRARNVEIQLLHQTREFGKIVTKHIRVVEISRQFFRICYLFPVKIRKNRNMMSKLFSRKIIQQIFPTRCGDRVRKRRKILQILRNFRNRA